MGGNVHLHKLLAGCKLVKPLFGLIFILFICFFSLFIATTTGKLFVSRISSEVQYTPSPAIPLVRGHPDAGPSAAGDLDTNVYGVVSRAAPH